MPRLTHHVVGKVVRTCAQVASSLILKSISARKMPMNGGNRQLVTDELVEFEK